MTCVSQCRGSSVHCVVHFATRVLPEEHSRMAGVQLGTATSWVVHAKPHWHCPPFFPVLLQHGAFEQLARPLSVMPQVQKPEPWSSQPTLKQEQSPGF